MVRRFFSWLTSLFRSRIPLDAEFYNIFFELSPLPHAITSRSGVLINVNEAFCKLHRSTRDELIGKSAVEAGFASQQELQAILEAFDKSGNRLEGHLLKYPLRNGDRIYVRMFAHAIRFKQRPAILIVCYDVSEQKAAEKKIRESERFLHTVINTIPIRIFWKDTNSIFKGCNQLAAQDVGFSSPDELVGKSDYDFYGPPLADKFIDDDRQVMSSGIEKLSFEESQSVRNGNLNWKLTSKVPLKDEAGNIVGVLGIYDDITQRKRVEADLQLARFSIDHATSSILWISSDGKILDFNPAFCQMLQYTREELLHLRIPDIDPQYTVDRWPLHWEQLRKDKVLTFLTTQLRKDGKELDVEVRAHYFEYLGREYNCAFINDITERKELEERLRVSHRFQRAVLNHIPSGVFWKDKNLKYLGANLFFRGIAGLTPHEDVAGKTDFNFPWKEQAEKIRADDREVIENNTTKLNFVEPLRNADGKIHYNEVSKVPLTDPDGEVIGILGVFRDITEQLETERALRESEKLFKGVVQNASAIIYIIDQEGIFRLSEGLGLAALGLKPGQVIGQSVFELYKDVPEITEIIRRALKGEIIANEVSVGGLTFSTRYTPMYNEQGLVTGILCVSFDITSRKKMEEELGKLNHELEHRLDQLRESEHKFRQIIQSSPTGIYVYEVNSSNQLVLVDTNAAADRLTGIENAKLIGKTIEEAFPGLEKTQIPNYYLNAALNGIPWLDDDFQFDNGFVKGIFQIYAFQAGHHRVAIMFLNITERKQIEEAIKQKNEELVKANSELDRFVYSASHDLRAPIASLLGLVQVARLEKDQHRLIDLFDMQERSLHKLDNFIHDIVSYSRNNRMKVEASTVNFRQIIEGVYEHLHFMEQFTAIDRRINVSDNLIFYSDSKRITVILNNLVSNAIKYADLTKENSFVDVNVSKATNGVQICVSDNGEGISDEFLPRIFDMFFRGTSKSSGSGIGLYIVNEIVHKMGGSVTVESRKGEGSKFYVTLPDICNS